MDSSSQEITAFADGQVESGHAPASRRTHELANGETVGRYLIVGRLGAGGMGIVYAAYDPELDRKLAIKLLRANLRGSTDEARTRLLREAQAMARLSHPNVVSVHDVGTHDGRVYLAMEFISGGTLKEWLKLPHPRAEVLTRFRQAGAGLAAAHAAGLIHRDFKPDNVLLGSAGECKVTDFGLARASPSMPSMSQETRSGDAVQPRDKSELLSTELTAYGSVMGTPAYMSPEQFGQGEVDARTDQFSFCVALWEGLTGARPFVSEGLPGLALAVSTGRITESPRSQRMPTWLRRVLLRGLRAKPSERFHSMDELLNALSNDPAPRRRIVLATSLVLAIGAGIVGYSKWSTSVARQACEDLGAEIEVAWSDQQRQQVQRAFRVVPGAYVEQTWSRVEQGLSSWAQQWRATAQDACVDATVTRTRTNDTYAANIRCLNDQRRTFTGLVQLLMQGGPQVPRRAVPAVIRLPRPADCLDDQVLRAYAQEGGASQVGDVTLARDRLALAGNLVAIGNYKEAVPAADEALAAAQRSGLTSLQADALVQVGELASATGDYEKAVGQLIAGMTLGATVGRDQLEADVALRLTRLEGLKLGHREAAKVWAELARIRILALGEQDGPRGATLHAALGGLHFANGDFSAALAEHQKALEIRLREFGEGHPVVGESQADLGLALREHGEYQRAIEALEAAVGSYEAALGPEHPTLGGLRNNLGNALFAAERRAEALKQYERSLAIHEAALGPKHPDVAASLGSLGLVQLANEDWPAAIASFHRVLAIYESALGEDHPGVAIVMDNLGQAQLGAEQNAAAVESFARGLAIRRAKLAPQHQDIAKSLALLGDAQLASNDLKGARTSFAEALTLARAQGGEDRRGQVIPLLGLAETSTIEKTDPTEAVAQVVLALEILAEQREPRPFEVARLTLRAAKVLALNRSADLGDVADRLRAARANLQGDDRATTALAERIETWLAAHESR